MEPKARLDGTVVAVLHRIGHDGAYLKLRSQPLTQCLGQIGHRLEGVRTFLPKPLVHLLGPELRLPDLLKVRRQLLQVELSYIGLDRLSGRLHILALV